MAVDKNRNRFKRFLFTFRFTYLHAADINTNRQYILVTYFCFFFYCFSLFIWVFSSHLILFLSSGCMWIAITGVGLQLLHSSPLNSEKMFSVACLLLQNIPLSTLFSEDPWHNCSRPFYIGTVSSLNLSLPGIWSPALCLLCNGRGFSVRML